MKKYALNIDDRKVLVSRLMELTGLHSRYTFMPRCAYIVGSYTVEKEGTLVIEDNAAPEIIRTLLDEGIIREEGAETPGDLGNRNRLRGELGIGVRRVG